MAERDPLERIERQYASDRLRYAWKERFGTCVKNERFVGVDSRRLRFPYDAPFGLEDRLRRRVFGLGWGSGRFDSRDLTEAQFFRIGRVHFAQNAGAGGERSAQHLFGKFVFHFALNRAAQRTRAVLRIPAFLCEQSLRLLR